MCGWVMVCGCVDCGFGWWYIVLILLGFARHVGFAVGVVIVAC